MNSSKGKPTFFFIIFSLNLVSQIISPTTTFASAESSSLEQEIIQEVNSLVPVSIQMVDQAIEKLSDGVDGLSSEELELLTAIYDPGNTGGIDDEALETMTINYRKIQKDLSGELVFEYAADSSMCEGMRLFYVYFKTIYVCPFFEIEESQERKARTLIHEIAHTSLRVLDRTYYDPKSYNAEYNTLVVRGPEITQVPVIGYVVREILRADTLYHPDTYAWFASLAFNLSAEV